MRAIILAGGRGRRLIPYTTIMPKPLMPIGDLPVLEVVIRQLRSAGFNRVTLAVGYLAELLMSYFGDGQKLGVEIDYSHESKPLGTAGPISLLSDLDETFLVMNGDLLTTLDFGAMWEFHKSHPAIATLAVYRRKVQIDLGVIQVDDSGYVEDYVEKPEYNYMVSTGIYIFDTKVMDYLASEEHIDLPDLVLRLIGNDHQVATYDFSGFWLDIGRHDDYEKAIEVFEDQRHMFLPSDESR